MPSKKRHPAAKTRKEPLSVKGFKASGIACGIKKGGLKDLAIILSDVPARVAGVYTTNRVKAAPVVLNRTRLSRGISRGVIINSGNANACTGKRGLEDARRMAGITEQATGAARGHILVSSTGVIGVPLPTEKIEKGLPRLVRGLSPAGWHSAAEAIMTTDSFSKIASAKAKISGRTVTVVGIAKGAGMICPDMATMLAFFATDANITGPALSKALRTAVDRSFNRITVDNDTSTNDTVLIFANGLSGGNKISVRSGGLGTFSRLLNQVSLSLAHMIVSDGEGATKFLEFHIKGAASEEDARLAARALAGSLLVKTAFFGGDPNWGRIMAVLGSSGIKMREEKVNITFNKVPVVRRGLDANKQKEAARAIKAGEVNVTVDLKMGKSNYKLWTTDLSYDYVRINSSYRT
jgi:glutamate N-acetyltransferase/amino-acid N-acetyltransferase